jgi:hypothetical protein
MLQSPLRVRHSAGRVPRWGYRAAWEHTPGCTVRPCLLARARDCPNRFSDVLDRTRRLYQCTARPKSGRAPNVSRYLALYLSQLSRGLMGRYDDNTTRLL